MMKQTCFFLCRRENSDIPLVVIGCVQEIEKRGKSKGLLGILNSINEIFLTLSPQQKLVFRGKQTSFGENFVKNP